MRKLLCLLLVGMFLLSTACADTLAIDTESATDDEITSMIEVLQAEKINRIKTRLANEVIEPDADGLILFRNIPWYSTRNQTKDILGVTSKDVELGNVYRLSYIDYSNAYDSSDYVEGQLGCYLYSRSYTVAGYQPSRTYFRFMVLVIDGEIIRDASIAQFYMGYYTFDGDDFGDLSLVYSDLESKLYALYGDGSYNPGEYHTYTIWKDNAGNMIRLQINSKRNNWLTLAYVANDVDARIDALAEAYEAEKTKKEEILRLKNTNNVDGL